MTRLAIKVEGLSKEYVLGGEATLQRTFREMIMGAVTEPMKRLKRLQGRSKQQERFWALKDVNFTVNEGEVVGIIGANGDGKSTLLKVLSRITAPTEGHIQYKGRIASLLEVGTGFHPELSGRENIFINGAILGMTKSEITKRFDEIVEFAGVEKFLDTPVKRYSSGMYVRLAFAVAAHMDPDILIVDEVLAVGDMAFQKKCLGKMGEVSKAGRTVLFVSHNMGMISKLCNRGLMMDKGVVMFYGETQEAIQAYYGKNSGAEKISKKEIFGDLKSILAFNDLKINYKKNRMNVVIRPNEAIRIEVQGTAGEDIENYRTTISIRKDGQLLVCLHDLVKPQLLKKGDFLSTVELPTFFLSPGDYWVSVGGYSTKNGKWIWVTNQAMFSITNEWYAEYDTTSKMGLINLYDKGSRKNL